MQQFHFTILAVKTLENLLSRVSRQMYVMCVCVYIYTPGEAMYTQQVVMYVGSLKNKAGASDNAVKSERKPKKYLHSFLISIYYCILQCHVNTI